MTTIVTKFEKSGYHCLPMGMFASGGIFQANLEKIIGGLEGVKIYIGDILLLIKDVFPKHKYHL